MKSALPTVAVVVGLVLLLTSFAWGALFPASASWTEEKSLRMSELKGRAHVLVTQVAAAKEKPTMHGGSNAAELEAEFEQVKAELRAARASGELARLNAEVVDPPQTTQRRPAAPVYAERR